MTGLNRIRMTAGQLRRGFEKMPRPCPAAILFGLDTGMQPDEVAALTWKDAKTLARDGGLSEYARHILNSQPVHIACQYVFWLERDGKPQPLFDIEWMVTQVFELLWNELELACDRLIWIDEEADAEDFSERFTQAAV